MPGDGIQGAAWTNTAQVISEDIDEICTISPDGLTIQIVSTGLSKTQTTIYTLNSDGGYTKGVVIT